MTYQLTEQPVRVKITVHLSDIYQKNMALVKGVIVPPTHTILAKLLDFEPDVRAAILSRWYIAPNGMISIDVVQFFIPTPVESKLRQQQVVFDDVPDLGVLINHIKRMVDEYETLEAERKNLLAQQEADKAAKKEAARIEAENRKSEEAKKNADTVHRQVAVIEEMADGSFRIRYLEYGYDLLVMERIDGKYVQIKKTLLPLDLDYDPLSNKFADGCYDED